MTGLRGDLGVRLFLWSAIAVRVSTRVACGENPKNSEAQRFIEQKSRRSALRRLDGSRIDLVF
jgi:hypothetical protein